MVTPTNRSSITSILLLITKAKPVGASVNNDQAGVPPPEVMGQKGNLLIRDLWKNGTDSVHDMRVVNTDAQ